MATVRYRGLARNHCHFQFEAMAMNMKRAMREPPKGGGASKMEKRGQMSG
jgi:hypothetical protein